MRLRIFLAMIFLCGSAALQADVLVIVHADNPLDRLEQRELMDLFMGRVSAFPGGHRAQPFDYASGTPVRGRFYKLLTGKNEAQVDAYWATLIFAGRMSPPRQVASPQAAIDAVAKNTAAIAYVPRRELPAGVKVISELVTGE